MVKVKFFGLLRLDLKCAETECKASTVEELLVEIASKLPITVSELRKCIIFVRGENITGLKLFKTELNEGDEVLLMQAVSGG
jgi:molybdopterin converting factor small subunit